MQGNTRSLDSWSIKINDSKKEASVFTILYPEGGSSSSSSFTADTGYIGGMDGL